VDDDNCRDELAIFGGQTRVLVSKLLTSKAPNWDVAFTNPSKAPSPTTKSGEDVRDPSKLPNGTMEDVHPSLMEYVTLFPPSAFAPDFNAFPNVPTQQPMLDQSIMSQVSALQPFNAGTELCDYSYPQYSLPQQQPDTQSQQQQYQSMGSMSPPAAPNSFTYDSSGSSFNAFSQPYSTATSTSASTPESGDLTDLGMMISGDSGMDEQWMSFMRESGILNRPNDTATLVA
jgi:hypothetical protein